MRRSRDEDVGISFGTYVFIDKVYSIRKFIIHGRNLITFTKSTPDCSSRNACLNQLSSGYTGDMSDGDDEDSDQNEESEEEVATAVDGWTRFVNTFWRMSFN